MRGGVSRSTNAAVRHAARLYRPRGTDLTLLLRSYALSDDIAFRFQDRGWAGWPLTPEKFAAALERIPGDDAVVGLFMDFETAGEHQDEATGILRFLAGVPQAVAAGTRFSFATPAEVAARGLPRRALALPGPVSWADAERDLSAWLGNDMQRAAHDALYANANNSKGLYRLRDTDGDDRFDEVKLLRQFPGGVGHGRNDLALGPDGMIYSMHGDSVEVPLDDIRDYTSPLRERRSGQKRTSSWSRR